MPKTIPNVNEVAGYLLSHGVATPIKSGRSHTNNPLTSWFWGWPQPDGRFDASNDGLAKAYLASLWAYRCITLRGKKVASIPLLVKTHDDKFVDSAGRPTDELPPLLVRQHILQRFLGAKHAKLRRLLEYDLCIWGKGFIDPQRSGLMRLNPSTIEIDKNNEGIERYRQILQGACVASWRPDELVYIYDFDPSDDLNGLSPLAFALNSVGAEVNIDAFVTSYFENDATPTGLLTTEQILTDEQITDIKGWWQKLFGGVRNKFKVGIVGQGLKYEQIADSMSNLAIPELRMEVRREVTAAFGVPMTIAGADEASNYACLPAGEKVLTPDGQRPIECFTEGDEVYTWRAGRSNVKRVQAVIRQPAPAMVYGIKTKWRTLRASDNHRILVADAQEPTGYRWVRATGLRADMWVVVCDKPGWFAAERVCSVEAIGPMEVWDLSIEGDHTFIAQGVVVHNTSAEQHLALYTETIIPEVEMIVSELNRQLVPHFDHTGNLKIVADLSGIEVLQRSKAELSARFTSLYQSGIYTLNDARRAEGMSPLDDDYVVAPNVGLVRVDDLPKLAERNIAPPEAMPSNFASMSPPSPDPEPPPESIVTPALPAPKEQFVVPIQRAHVGVHSVMPGHPSVQPVRSVGQDAYVSLPLAGAPALRTALEAAQAAYGSAAAEWVEPSRWHCTLVYAAGVPDATLGQIGREIAARDPISLEPEGLSVFDDGPRRSLVIELRKTPALAALQREVYGLFSGRDLAASPHSRPARYRPHVTLGVLPEGVDVEDVPDVAIEPLAGNSIQVSRPGHKVVREVTLVSTEAKSGLVAHSVVQAAALADLRRYENKLLLKGIKSQFTDSAIPGPVMFWLRCDLDSGDGTQASIKQVVETAARTLQGDPQELQEFLDYWKDIDDHAAGLVDELGNILADPELLKELAVQIQETGNPDTAVSTFFDTLTNKQVERLVGTEEAPGPLTAIVLAGIGRGEQLLGKLDAQNAPPTPKRSTSRKAKVTVDASYQLLNRQALDWARAYAYDLVRGINGTTTQTFRDTFSDWITRGGSMPGLVDMLHGRLQGLDIPQGWSDKKLKWATSRERARVIGQTESTRAFHQGNQTKWQQAGVDQARFRTQVDRLVCPLCSSLNGAIGNIGQGFPVPAKFRAKHGPLIDIPCHVGCRCWSVPVASSRTSPLTPMSPDVKPERQTADTIAVGGTAAEV